MKHILWLIRNHNQQIYRLMLSNDNHQFNSIFSIHLHATVKFKFFLSLSLQGTTMKLDFTSSDLSYNTSITILKLSGFLFFTVVTTPEGLTEFRQFWSDYASFLISISFSIYIAFCSESSDLNFKRKSTILNLGTEFLWKISLFSILLTKIILLISARQGFNVVRLAKLIDRQV